jgi:hypothetical protein
MNNQSQFKPDAAISLLLMGSPGAGKTNLAMEFPSPYFIDWGDANLASAVNRHSGKPFFYDSVSIGADGKPIEPDRQWERASALLKENGPKDEVGCIVDDTLSMMQVALCQHIVRLGSQAETPLVIGGVKVMTRSMWNAFSDLLRKRIHVAKSFGKPYLLTCHEKVDADDMSAVKIYRPNLSGQLGDSIASLFSDFWSCETDPNADKKVYQNGVRYFVRTVPTNRIKLKCSCGLPGEFEFTWEKFQRHVEQQRSAK